MLTILMALIGLPVGVVLDVLIERLATEPYDEDEDIDTPAVSAGRSIHAEAGALLVTHDHVWRRRAIVIVATSALFAIAAARYDSAAELTVVSAYICALLICAATDLLSYRVPNVITYPAILGALAAAALMPDANFYDALFGGLLAGGILLLPAIFTGGVGMGMGDVKLALFAGLAVGFQLVPIALLVMALGGGAVAATMLVSGRRKRGEPIPYAPFISGGALVTLLWLGAAFTSFT